MSGGANLAIAFRGPACAVAGLDDDGWRQQAVDSASPSIHIDRLALGETRRAVRKGAEPRYAAATRLAGMELRVLLALGRRGAMCSSALVGLLGVDKAYVSRAVRQLESLGLAQRRTLRSPVVLGFAGMELAKRVLRQEDAYDRALIEGIDAPARAAFLALADRLTERAQSLLERERAGDAGPRDGDAGLTGRLFRLCDTIRRVRLLLLHEQAGLALLEAEVLAVLARNGATHWGDVVRLIDRDQSQTWRVVDGLIGKGLVVRFGAPNRRQGVLMPSMRAREAHAAVEAAWDDCSAFLLDGVSADRFARFGAALAGIARNASTP